MVQWCVDCEDFLCEECLKQHERIRMFLSHKTVAKELFRARSPDMVFSTTSQPEYDSCKKHNKLLDLYCTTCDILICQSCAENDHRDRQKHQYHTVNILADEVRDKLKTLGVSLTTTLLEQVNAAIKKVENSDNEVNNEANFKGEVQDTYHQFHEKLKQCEKKDLQILENAKTSLSMSLGSQKENLKSLKACLISYNEFISKVTSKERASQLLTHNNEIQKKINNLANQVQEACHEKVCGTDHLILSTSNLNDLVSHFTSLCRVSTLPHLPNCTVKGPPAMSKYGPISVTIILKDEDGRPVPNQTEHLTVHFQDENISNNVKVEEKSTNVYVLSYKANKRETHGLSVSWKGQCLGEITMQAKVRDYPAIKQPLQEPITKYGKQNKITCPHLMALGPNDELIVRDCHEKSLVVFDSDLKFSHMIAVDEPAPTGLAIAKGYLYMSIDHAIKKVQMDGKLVFEFGTKGAEDGQFNSPRGLVLGKNDLLYVCDKKNHRIQVLQENHFLFSFGKNGKRSGMFNEPYDLAFNNAEDLLFITDCSNHRIQLFTPSGQFLKLFGDLTKIPGILRFPTGICYTPDDYVLICSSNSHCMLIFKEDDTFVSTVAIEGVDGKQAYADPVGVVMKMAVSLLLDVIAIN